MSHVHDGPLATYNSLSDDHLSGYFANSRMRRHLRKSGLISRGGQIVSESTYRLNMSRKEHKKHVKDMLAQAIVHKTLDLERSRQSDIKKKLEEIAKIQLVRRVRATTGRRGDEDILPLLTPRASRPGSSPAYQEGKGRSRGSKHRPYSAPRARAESRLSQMSVEEEGDVLYLDDEGRPLTPVHNDHNFGEQNQIDTRHLHTMDTAALRKYAMLMATMEEGRGVTSPYMLSQVPLPPKTPMSSRTPRSARRVQSASPQRPVTTDSRIARLHRPETAKVHYGDQQTMCKVLMKYHGWALKLAREKMDPTQEVVIEQQHCGGNTLTVFKDRLLPGSAFEFISYRHRGYPFSLSLYVDGQMDSRVSTCCEYRHKRGAKIGGKQGHFSVLKVEGAVPCYKCQVAKGVVMRNKATSKKPKRVVKPHKEEVIVVSTARDDYDNEYLERRVEEPKPSSEDTKEKAVVVAVEKEEKDADDRKLKSAKSADASYDDDFEASSKTSDSSSSSSDSESETESSTRKDEGGDNNQAASKEKFRPFEARGEDSEAVSPSPRASDQRAVQSPSPRFKSPRVEVNGTGRDIDDYSSDGGQENKDKVVSMEDVEAETKPIGRRGSSSSSSSSPSSSSASGTPRAHDSQRQRDDNAVVSMAILDKEEDKKKERERQDEVRRREREEQLQQQREERDKRQEEARQREEQRRQELQYREQERQEESRKREEQRKLAEEKERQRRQEEEENRRKAALMEEDPELKDQERMKAQRLREAQILEEQIQREATRKEEERAREQRFREEEARRVEQRERDEADRDRRRQELEESMSRTGSSTARSTSSAATGSSASTSASSSPQTTPHRAPQTQDETQTPRDASLQRVDPYLLGAKPQEDQLPPRPVSPFPDAAVYVARPKRHEPVPEPAVYQPRSRPTQEATSPEQAPREEEKEQQDTFRSSASETNPSSSQYSASDSEEDEEQEELARPKTAAGGRLRDGRRLSDEGW